MRSHSRVTAAPSASEVEEKITAVNFPNSAPPSSSSEILAPSLVIYKGREAGASATSAGWKWAPAAAPAEWMSSPQAWGSNTGHPPTTSTLALLPPSWVPIILSSPHGSLGSREALGPPEAHSTTLSLTSSFPTVHWDHWRLTRKWRGGVQPGPC